MPDHPAERVSINVRLQIQEFKIPPVQDALVLGKKSPIGSKAMRRSLDLLHVAPFEPIELTEEDDVVGEILVRQSVLNKIPKEKLVQLIMSRVKPFMCQEEILQVDIEAALALEEQI